MKVQPHCRCSGENRLISVTKGTHRTEFVYDGLGRRVQILEKEVATDQTTTTSSDRKFLWAGTEIAEERRGDDGGTVQKRFFAQGFVDSDGTILLYTRDHLGSIRELVDMQQNVRARYEYDPYGNVTKVSGDKDSDFLYTGHLWHAQSGVYLTLFRAYDPELGRWLSRDPIEEQGGINLYAYVGNKPIGLVDPFGLDWWDPIGGWDWLQDLSDFSAGWGDKLSGGLTQKFRETYGYDQYVNKCSGWYSAGEWTGIAHNAAMIAASLWRMGLNGGSNSVFWSGWNAKARTAAEALGTTLEKTPIGKVLDTVLNSNTVRNNISKTLTNPIWNAASRSFATNATGTARAVIRVPGPTWTNIESRILANRGIPVIFYP